MIGQLVVVWKQYLIYLLTSLSPVLYRGSGEKTSRRKRGEGLRTSKRKAPIGPQQEQIEHLEFLTFLLCVLVGTLTVTVLLLSVRFNNFASFTIDWLNRCLLISQQLNKLIS